MPKVSTNINLDPELKKAAQELFHALGMDLTTAVTVFLCQAVQDGGIPFEIKRKPNPETVAALAEFDAMKQNPASYKRYSSFREGMNEV